MANEIIIREAATRMDGVSLFLAGGTEKVFKGPPSPLHRKQIIITNEDDTRRLHLVRKGVSSTSGNAKLMTIYPNESKVIFTSDDVTVANLNAAGTSAELQVIEVFYK